MAPLQKTLQFSKDGTIAVVRSSLSLFSLYLLLSFLGAYASAKITSSSYPSMRKPDYGRTELYVHSLFVSFSLRISPFT
ncbi:hypothetical protein C8J56DRAFT_916140 [Mycena floridula]|nr:hypothetical protein C8J56DRAFT_916140 [Mycena floridula]